MRMKSNLKKVLSVVLAASVVTTTSVLAGLAAGASTVSGEAEGPSLLPIEGTTEAVPYTSGGEGNATIAFDENGIATISQSVVAWAAWPEMKTTFDTPLEVNLNEYPLLYFDIGGTAGEANFSFDYVDASGEHTFTASSFIGKDAGFNLVRADGELSGTYDVREYLAAREGRLPEDGIITISEVRYQVIGETGVTTIWNTLTFGADQPEEPAVSKNAQYEELLPKDFWGATTVVDLMQFDGNFNHQYNNANVNAEVLEDGSIHITSNGQGNPWGGQGYTTWKEIDLSATPYLYYSIEDPNKTNWNITFYQSTDFGKAWQFALKDMLIEADQKVQNTGTVSGRLDLRDLLPAADKNTETPNKRVITGLIYGIGSLQTDVNFKYLFIGDGSDVPPVPTDPSETESTETEPTETEPTQPEEPTTGTPATPDAPYYNWAATSKPENVEVGFDLLAWADFDSITDSPFVINEDGSVSFTWSGFKPYTMPVGAEVNLEENPYLYWSIEQGAGSRTTFVLYPQDGAPYGIYRSYTDPDNMFITSDNTTSADNYIDGSETGCFNMYEWLNENGYDSLDAKMIKDIVIAASRQVDTTINYLFFGPAPTTETEPTETEPTETEPTETEPSQTEPSQTEPSETEPSETEPSETQPTDPVEPADQEIFSFDPADWEFDSSIMQVTNGADGSLVYYNTNGEWPSATYRYETPITIDPKTTSLSYDFTGVPGAQISFLLFVNDCTPEDFEGKDDRQFKPHQYMEGVNIDAGSGDILSDGNPIKGVLDLSTVPFSDACYNEDGTITFNAIRIFAVGAANSNIEVRDFRLISNTDPTDPTVTDPSETEPSDTDPSETDPSETQPSATDSTASVTDTTATTAAPTTGNGGNNSPATGENTALAMVGGLLLIGSAGALILTKKKKA